MKKIILFLFLSIVFAQKAGFVESGHNIYSFLERMNNLRFIEDYDLSRVPKSRSEVCDFLLEIKKNKSDLSRIDKNFLSEYLKEFEYEINGTTQNYKKLIDGNEYNFTDGNEKYLYFSADENNALFVNFVGEIENLYENDSFNDRTVSANLINFGGILRGSLGKNFAFYIKATNGTYSGNKDLTFSKSNLRYNYKFATMPESASGTDFYDETTGYLSAKFDDLILKIGRDRNLLGIGNSKMLLSDQYPPMDYFSLEYKYKIFSFDYLHGKLLGSESIISDPIKGNVKEITDKFYVYHRFGFNFGKHLQLGIGETAIYSGRSLDLSYLNPFNFYKSVEHLNQDRDNTLLFVDAQNNSFKGFTFYTTFLIDDIDFSKLGSDWFGNKTAFNFGIYSSILYQYIPLDINIEYNAIRPYVYTHRLTDNNFTSLGYSIVDPLEPNSSNLTVKLIYTPHHRISVETLTRFTKHGANLTDTNRNLVYNYGGDISQGHRTIDSDDAVFLAGVKEKRVDFGLKIIMEPINNYFITLNAVYKYETVEGSESENRFNSFLNFAIKL